MIGRWMLVAGITVLTAGAAKAASSWTQLTPATLGSQRLDITVSHSGTAKTEQFQVTVKRKVGVPYHSLHPNGWLEDGRFAGEGKPFPCPVIVREQGKGTTIYQFTLPARYQAHARFYFGYAGYDTGKMVMPSGDFYWFRPAAFVHQSKSSRD